MICNLSRTVALSSLLKGENSANCVDNEGSFDCFCKKGFENNTEALCVNKNECLIGRVFKSAFLDFVSLSYGPKIFSKV